MLSSFRKAYLLHYLFGFGFIIICWLPTFFISQESVTSQVLNSDTVLKMGFSNVYLLNILGIVITLISALILNHLTTEYGLTGKLMTMGIFFFAVLSVSISSFTIMNPFIIINFFLFFFIRNIYRLPNIDNPIPLIFNSSLMLGLASLYFFHIVLLLVILWAGLLLHRTNSWRNYFASLIGLITPYVFILTWYYWSDQLQDYLLRLNETTFFAMNQLPAVNLFDLIIALSVMLLLLFGTVKTYISLGEKNINLRRNLIVTMYFLVVSTLIFLLFATELKAALIIVIPAALILSNAFQDLQQYKWYNIIFSVLTGAIVINHYLKLI